MQWMKELRERREKGCLESQWVPVGGAALLGGKTELLQTGGVNGHVDTQVQRLITAVWVMTEQSKFLLLLNSCSF